ncbi:Septation initiation network scaffold protein cdc11 [Talaromyces islandicus]|uniref:Septation initiation network scaffold protein cdc11 n=1 Tax=Talaromyces islandicus TaxID=28573 RepID=A0A0U1LNL6_TALIS|nr:Septation initiation network scaffold protein cdc11 [Talaromyces islandicus]
MSKEPWLAELPDEDWISQPSSPCPLPHSPSSPSQQSARKCIGCSHRSRMPKPEPVSPSVRGKSTPRGARQGQTRRGGSTTPSSSRASPSPRNSPSARSPRVLNNAPPKSSNTKQTTPGRKKSASTPLKNMVSAKSNTPESNLTDGQGTVQVRPGKDDSKGTPEWKRRLIQGGMAPDEQCDLFAPMGLESMFIKGPVAGGESEDPHDQANGAKTNKPADALRRQSSPTQDASAKLNSRLQQRSINARSMSSKRSKLGFDGVSEVEGRSRTASGEEDLRNEGITPIFLSASNTADRRTGSGVLQSALKQLNHIAGTSNGSIKQQHKSTNEAGELLNFSSPYFPEGLSTGTQEEVQTKPFVNFRRGGHSDDGSFRMRQLSPSSPSQLEKSDFCSSPPSHLQDDVPAVAFSPTDDDPRPHTANMNSPLKLFGNHDTFTNNKLLRRMSQFEETLGDGLSDENDPASPTLSTRNTRANRSLPNLRRGQLDGHSPRKIARPVTQDAADPRMNRFGNGQLDGFGFADESAHSGRVPNLSFQSRYPREAQSKRRSYSRVLGRDPLRKARSFDSIPETRRSSSSRQFMTSRSKEKAQLGLHTRRVNSGTTQPSNLPPKGSTPKRRRTREKTDALYDADELAESLLEMNLEGRGLQHQLQESNHFSPATGTPGSLRSKQKGNRWEPSPSESPFDTDASKEDLASENYKRSLTTDDYLDQATKVMDFIRAKGKYQSGLTSVEESDITSPDNEEDTLTEISSPENLSRPPSRDGIDMRKYREPKQLHPRVVSHLKKFADKEDTEQLMESVVSHLDKESQPDLKGETEYEDDIQSNPRNIRILPPRKRKHSDDGQVNSIPSTSSNASNARGIIASDMVSHLIPEQVNGMIYDQSTKSWVRQKDGRSIEKTRGDESEDDPFGSIPDLSVNSAEEAVRSFPRTKDGPITDGPRSRIELDTTKLSAGQRPTTRDGSAFVPDSSSVHSKTTTRFTSSGPQPETRATSWGTEDITINVRQLSSPHSKGTGNETKLLDGSTFGHVRRPKASGQTRAATISFSSPLVSQIVYTDDTNETQLNGNVNEHSDERRNNDSSTPGTTTRTSLDSREFVRRPISRIDEQNEESMEEMSLVRRVSAEQSSSTPQLQRGGNSLAYLQSAEGNSYSFHLSPLADFTMNQPDDPVNLEISYIAQRTHPSSLRQIHGTFELAAQDLVKHITDVEPSEPFWEDIRRLNLRNKGLITLHSLNDFCPRLETLDVSENELGHLIGAPYTIRDLRASQNCLSNLTAWGHLANLQYLDVSGNQLESLDGFSGLIHLRELKANNNKIRSIDGILDLNGLLRLDLKSNALTSIDFEGSELTRLSEIDVSDNQITAIRNLEYLPALETLNVSANELKKLPTVVPINTLRTLRASKNRFNYFDAAMFPHLKLLYLDDNYLSSVSGLSKCSSLEILSVREQFAGTLHESGSPLDIDIAHLTDIRKLYLSSNRLSERTLSPSSPVLGLQLLDIASCGLQAIPPRFGKLFPNLRVLNLNFNSVSELDNIAGMSGLNRLTVAENRVSRLRTLCQVLSRIGRSAHHGDSPLRNIDLRGNPLTIGFYPPPVSGSGRADTHLKLLEIRRREIEMRKSRIQADAGSLITTSGDGDDNAVAVERKNSKDVIETRTEIEIDDPYTIPPADATADQKHRSHLHESTKKRRMMLELLMYATTGGSLKMLDGLELRPILEDEKAGIDKLWAQLEQLGVFKKKTYGW